MTSALWPRVPSTQLEPTSPSFVAASTHTSVAPCAAGSASSMRIVVRRAPSTRTASRGAWAARRLVAGCRTAPPRGRCRSAAASEDALRRHDDDGLAGGVRRDERRDEAEERAADELRICGVLTVPPAAPGGPTCSRLPRRSPHGRSPPKRRAAALGGGEEDSGVAVGAGRRGRVRARGRRGAGVALRAVLEHHGLELAPAWDRVWAELKLVRRRAATRTAATRRCLAARSIPVTLQSSPPAGTDRRELYREPVERITAANRRQPARRTRGGPQRCARARAVGRRRGPSGQSEESWVVTREAFRSSAGVQLSSSGRGWACSRARGGGGGGRACLLCRLRAQRLGQRPSRGRRGARTIGSIARRQVPAAQRTCGRARRASSEHPYNQEGFDRFGQTAFPKRGCWSSPERRASRARAWAVRARAARWRGNCRRHGIRLWVVIRLV